MELGLELHVFPVDHVVAVLFGRKVPGLHVCHVLPHGPGDHPGHIAVPLDEFGYEGLELPGDIGDYEQLPIALDSRPYRKDRDVQGAT